MIAFVGSVFSPYYAWQRRRGDADPHDHCALNVAIYGAGGRWSMTERGRGALSRSTYCLAIGPSALHWDGESLSIDIDEVCAPLPRRIRGRVRLTPGAMLDHRVALDAGGRHIWQPIAPCARIEVALERPALRWQGSGYLDANYGDAPLEDAFARWDWSRAELPGGDVAVLYDVERRDGSRFSLAQRFDTRGGINVFDPPPRASLPHTRWRVTRGTRSETENTVRIVDRFEDAPFYARSAIATHLCGAPVIAMHESLSLARFRARWVQALLPFRMPRAPARRGT